MLNVLTAGALALSALTAPVQVATAADPPDGSVKVQVVTANGTGCPVGSTAVAMDPQGENSFFTVTYDKFLAQAGAGTAPTDSRRSCQVTVQVKVPQGFTFAIAKTDFRGFASLQRGSYGTEKASYYFSGMSETPSMSHRYNGPMEDDWQATDQVTVGSLSFRPCGSTRYFNIKTEVVVNAGSADRSTTSYMSMDSTDVDFSTIYHLAWKPC
jgi:hypothetical protein